MAVDLATANPATARDLVPANEILREITRGGIAGLIAGVLVAGVGGRLVMRLAALLVPGSAGAVTENGNRIGDITAGGTFALILFIGLLFGSLAGSLWVTLRPWLPSAAGLRALVSIPITVALGTRGLVDGTNRDFIVLEGSALVVASLVALVALFGPTLVLAERWLDARLPHAGPDDARVIAGYGVITMIGLMLTVLAVVPAYLGGDMRTAGIALVVVGAATAGSWLLRATDRPIPAWVGIVARLAIASAVIAGSAVALGEATEAIGRS